MDRHLHHAALPDTVGWRICLSLVVPPLPGFFNTLGAFGQVIYVSRERGLVVVFTANLPNETANSIFQQIIRDYVVPAAQ